MRDGVPKMNRTTLLARMKKLAIDPKLFPLPRDPDRRNSATATQHACDLIPAC